MNVQGLLFEVGSAFSITGISFIFFLAGALVNEKSPGAFRQMYSSSSGVLFCSGLSFAYHFYTINEGLYFICLIASSSVFIALLCVSIFHTKTSKDYSVLSTSSANAEKRLEDIEHWKDNSDNGVIVETTLFDQPTVALKLCLCSLIVLKSLSNLLVGLLLAIIDDIAQWDVALIIVDRVIMALTLSTILEASVVPGMLFLLSMSAYSCSTSLGVIIGMLVTEIISTASNDFRGLEYALKYVNTIIHACACGSYLYMSLLIMVPIVMQRPNEVEEEEADRRHNNSTSTYKLMVTMSFVLGYVVSLISHIMIYYLTQ